MNDSGVLHSSDKLMLAKLTFTSLNIPTLCQKTCNELAFHTYISQKCLFPTCETQSQQKCLLSKLISASNPS